ncbi:hypothetical protein Emag_000639 [Eimeria magna]
MASHIKPAGQQQQQQQQQQEQQQQQQQQQQHTTWSLRSFLDKEVGALCIDGSDSIFISIENNLLVFKKRKPQDTLLHAIVVQAITPKPACTQKPQNKIAFARGHSVFNTCKQSTSRALPRNLTDRSSSSSSSSSSSKGQQQQQPSAKAALTPATTAAKKKRPFQSNSTKTCSKQQQQQQQQQLQRQVLLQHLQQQQLQQQVLLQQLQQQQLCNAADPPVLRYR